MNSQCIAVYGASGHTGKFVVAELERRGAHVVAIARKVPPEFAKHPRWREASCDDPESLDRALIGARAVINCAGPFSETAPAVIEAALRGGIHYFDVSAEQRAVRQSLATYDVEARQAGVVVMPAIAFYGGLADLLASALARDVGTVDEIEIAVALSYWHPTVGTRRTGESNTARRMVIADGRLAPMESMASQGRWHFAEPYASQAVAQVPLSEIITISRHIKAQTIRSYMTTGPLQELRDVRTPPPVASDASGRSSQHFMMDVVVRDDRGAARIVATGQDIYATSAPLVVEACHRVLRKFDGQGGAFVAGQLFEANDFLSALSSTIQITRPAATATLMAH